MLTPEQPLPCAAVIAGYYSEGVQDVTPAVIEDLRARTALGVERYGRPLQAHNGRNALQDAYEEALDLVQYLKQALLEREGGNLALEQGGNRYRWVTIASPVICSGCGRVVRADGNNHFAVIADAINGSVGFFCSAECGRIPYREVVSAPWRGPTQPAQPVDCIQRPLGEHYGMKPHPKGNGGVSCILVTCERCGAGFDPTFHVSRRGCRGVR